MVAGKKDGAFMDPTAKYGVLFFLSFISVLTCFDLKFTFLGDTFCLPSLSLSSHNQPADRQTSAVIDDASPSPTTFSLGP